MGLNCCQLSTKVDQTCEMLLQRLVLVTVSVGRSDSQQTEKWEAFVF